MSQRYMRYTEDHDHRWPALPVHMCNRGDDRALPCAFAIRGEQEFRLSRAMEPAIGALQFVWIAGHRRQFATHDDYFIELVEHLTSVTPDIDRRVARVISRYRRHLRLGPPHPRDPSGSS